MFGLNKSMPLFGYIHFHPLAKVLLVIWARPREPMPETEKQQLPAKSPQLKLYKMPLPALPNCSSFQRFTADLTQEDCSDKMEQPAAPPAGHATWASPGKSSTRLPVGAEQTPFQMQQTSPQTIPTYSQRLKERQNFPFSATTGRLCQRENFLKLIFVPTHQQNM